MEMCSKHSFLKFFTLFLHMGVVLSQKSEMWGVCMFQGQIGKIDSQNPRKVGIFLVLALFSTSPSLKSGLPTPVKLHFT